jgi:hypothetical protein
MAETVNLNEDGRRATITGRKRASLQQKMNPMWWWASTKKISNVVIYSQSRAGKSYLRTPWRLRAGAQTGNGRISDHGQVQKSMEGAVLWIELPATHPRLVKQEKEKEPELSHNAAWAL